MMIHGRLCVCEKLAKVNNVCRSLSASEKRIRSATWILGEHQSVCSATTCCKSRARVANLIGPRAAWRQRQWLLTGGRWWKLRQIVSSVCLFVCPYISPARQLRQHLKLPLCRAARAAVPRANSRGPSHWLRWNAEIPDRPPAIPIAGFLL